MTRRGFLDASAIGTLYQDSPEHPDGLVLPYPLRPAEGSDGCDVDPDGAAGEPAIDNFTGAVGSRKRATALLLALTLVGGCSDHDADRSSATTSTPSASAAGERRPAAVPLLERPRYRASGDLRLEITNERPLFLYNVYVGQDESVIDHLVELWPDDLRDYLGVQVVFPSKPALDASARAAAMEPYLERTDAAQVPAMVQTAAFTGMTGPDASEMDQAFADHPSLVGVGIAELSADYVTSVGGLSDAQKDLIVAQIDSAVRNDALFLWADMGYLGPQVFVDAGADRRLVDLMREHHDHIVIQAKQNGLGRRFGTWSAASGMYLAGLADNWGVNSEDWVWFESSFERLFEPQVPGGLSVTGMVRSEQANRSRLTYPESLFGTELLVAAAAGATVFSIEAPARGTIDAERATVSPAGTEVVFPVLRRVIADRLIPDRDAVLDRTPLALHPLDRDSAILATDEIFDGLYGPEGCGDGDRLVCAQRQWLPSTGRYGIVPTIPALSDEAITSRFATVVDLDDDAVDRLQQAADAITAEPAAGGDSWATRPVPDVWFVANPNENSDVTTTFELPPQHDRSASGELGPHTFAIIESSADGLQVLVDNFRSDTGGLWASGTADDQLGSIDLASIPAAAPAVTHIRVVSMDGTRLRVTSNRPELVSSQWDGGAQALDIEVRHRGPVTLDVTPDA